MYRVHANLIIWQVVKRRRKITSFFFTEIDISKRKWNHIVTLKEILRSSKLKERDLCLVVKWPLFLEYSNGGWCWKEVHLHHHPHLLRFLGFKLLKWVLLFSLLLPTWDSSINAHYYHIIIFFTKVKERSLIYTRTISFYGKRKIKYIGRRDESKGAFNSIFFFHW